MTLQYPLPLPHVAAMGADDFMVAACNRDAVAWIEKFPDWPAPGLIISGAAGSGKTHLLNVWLAKSGGALIEAAALSEMDCVALTTATKAVALDNADRFAGDGEAETRLFHLFNQVKENQGALVLAMTQPVAHAGFALPDLRSRLLSLPVAALLPPDDDLLETLLVKQFFDRQIVLDTGVVSYLAKRMPRNAAGVRDLVERLDRAALAEKSRISISLARKVLETLDESA